MASKGYTTKEAVENYNLVEIDNSFNDQVDEWIESVEEYIDHETNRDFGPVSRDEDGDIDAVAEDRTFDGDGSNTLVIDAAAEIEEIRFSETGDPIDVDQYVLHPIRKDTTTQIVLKNLRFPRGMQNIYVKAKWGYAAVPKDIKLAATVLVAGIINNAWQSEGEVQSMTIGRYSVTYKTKQQVDDFNKIEEILAFNKRYTF